MKNKKILIIAFSILLIFLTFIPILPVAQASESTQLEKIRAGEQGRRLVVYNPETMTISTVEWSHVLHAISYTESEKAEWEKVRIKLILDGNEIHLHKVQEVDYSGEEVTYINWFFRVFNPDFFIPKIYNWTIRAEDKNEIKWSETYPLTVLKGGHRIDIKKPVSMVITPLERCYVKHGFIFSEQKYKKVKPVNIQVFLDGEEIELFRVKEKVCVGGIRKIKIHFYQTFAPGFFEPGVHEWKVIRSNKNGIIEELTYPLIVLEDGHRLMAFDPDTMTITTSQPCYIYHGIGYTPDANEVLENKPIKIQLFINGINVKLQKSTRIDYSGEAPTYWWDFYKSFEVGYFEPGIYSVQVVWRDKNGILFEASHPLTVLEDAHRLTVYTPETMTIPTSQRSFIRQGFGFSSPEELLEYAPYDSQLFINDIELDLYQSATIDTSGETISYILHYYYNFEPGYFEPGIYEWRVVFSDNTGAIYELMNPLIVTEDGQRLLPYDPSTMTITTSQPCYIRNGYGFSPDANEILEGFPWLVQLFIDGEEIMLDQNTFVDDSGEEPLYIWNFYKAFEPGYFEPGIYGFHVVWSNNTDIVWESTYPLTVLQDGHRFLAWSPESMVIPTSQRSYVKNGHGFSSPEELLENDPYDVQLFINDMELDLYQQVIIDTSGETTSYFLYYYYNFNPGYFEPGIYEFKAIWTDNTGIIYESMNPLIVTEDGHRLNVNDPSTMTITTSLPCYISHGLGYTPDANEVLDYKPLSVQLYVDGIEIELQQNTEIDDSGEDPIYFWSFYKAFEPGYFEPGVHEWHVIWSDVNGIFYEASFPLTVLEDVHRLAFYDPESMTIPTSQRCYIKHGHAFSSPEEILEFAPYDLQLFVNDMEVDLYQSVIVDTSGETTAYILNYYYSFNPGYFEPEEYNWNIVWSDNTGTIYEVTETLTVQEDGQRLKVYDPATMTITESQPCYISHGFGFSPDANEVLEGSPWLVQLFIDGDEIILDQNTFIDNSGGEPTYFWNFYKAFKPGYFEPGTYDIHIVWSNNTDIVWEASYPLTVLEDVPEEDHQINIWNPSSMTISTRQRTFVRHGWDFADEAEMLQVEPFWMELYVDGEFIALESETYTDEFGIHVKFFRYFEPYYFEIGQHDWQLKFFENGIDIMTFDEILTVNP